MTSGRVITGIALIGALTAAPVWAADGRQRRGDDRQPQRQAERHDGEARQQAVARDDGRRNDAARAAEANRQIQVQRQVEAQGQVQAQRQGQRPYYAPPRNYNYNVSRGYPRQFYSYARGGYVPRTIYVPRYVRPAIVTVVPYQPYFYRPSIALGVYYGVGGAYPYGYTPREYYDPIPGRLYGGVRIVGAPRAAQVFADGYYVGIVNDFDGVFQHMNLEAGPHHIEVVVPGMQPIEFDVDVQPGRTITFRADVY
jgi:hypothetical protein